MPEAVARIHRRTGDITLLNHQQVVHTAARVATFTLPDHTWDEIDRSCFTLCGCAFLVESQVEGFQVRVNNSVSRAPRRDGDAYTAAMPSISHQTSSLTIMQRDRLQGSSAIPKKVFGDVTPDCQNCRQQRALPLIQDGLKALDVLGRLSDDTACTELPTSRTARLLLFAVPPCC